MKIKRSLGIGSAFLMATSAIGPGFLTQTAFFTEKLLASFGFVILVSIILDLGVQLNIWRMITVTGKRGQDLANCVLPGLGHFLAISVSLGGLIFNIGNMAGTGLGLKVLFDLPPTLGAAISASIAIGLFLIKNASEAMDRVASYLGGVMILLTLYVAIISAPPMGQATLGIIKPETIDVFAIMTLVGGTVGGYISFAGGHRLLEAGVVGKENLPYATRSSILGIFITSLMRIILYLAVLGVVAKGFHLDPANPAASVFQQAAGSIGYKIFGVVLWAASITSVIGSSYTSISFLRSFSRRLDRGPKKAIVCFIILSAFLFLLLGTEASKDKPIKLLIWAGSLNSLILPLALGAILVASQKKSLMNGVRHPFWLTVIGWLVVIAMASLSVMSWRTL